MKRLALLFLLCGLMAFGQTVTVSDTIRVAPSNTLFTGILTIISPYITYNGVSYVPGQTRVTVVSGVFSASLIPNLGPLVSPSTPNTSYSVRYEPRQPSTQAPWSETWQVSATVCAGGCTIAQVRVSNITGPSGSALRDPTTSTGDIIYRSSAGLARLGVGSSGYVLGVSGGVPAWVQASEGTGTVTSVGLALPTEFTVSNSPVTTTGTLTGSWASGAANRFLGTPNGAPGIPSLRALVAADIPALSYEPPISAGTSGQFLSYNKTMAQVSYADLSNVPSTFAPSAHASSHGSGQGDAVTLAQSQITNLTTDLGNKASTTHASTHGSGQSDAVTIAQSQVTNLTTDLGNKASTTHASTHGSGQSDAVTVAQSQVTNLTTDLGNKITAPSLTDAALKYLRRNAGNDAWEMSVFSTDARAALSGTSPISYDSGTGEVSCPTCVNSDAEVQAALSAGTGLDYASGTFSVDRTLIPEYGTGTVAPTGNCTPGALFIDTSAQYLYYCATTNTWLQLPNFDDIPTLGANPSFSFTNETAVTLNHNLGTLNILVVCYNASDVLVEPNTVHPTTTNAAEVTFTNAQTGRCVVNGNGGSGGGGASLPDQTGHANQALITNGSAADWSVITHIQGRAVQDADPTDGQVMTWVTANQRWEPAVVTAEPEIVAGPGIAVTGNEVAVDSATVPTYLTGTASLNYGSIANAACAVLTLTVTGALTGDAVMLGAPATLETGLIGFGLVTAADTVTIRVCNLSGGSVDPAANTWRATIVRSF